jgi:2-dehydropantoate 2-reductase
VREDGLWITGLLDRHVHPAASTSPPAAADLVVLAVKSYDTAPAARELADVDVGAVLSLQNGLGNEATLASHLDCKVLAGTATYGARLAEPGVVECTGRGEIVLGPHEGGESGLAEGVGDLFAAAGLETTVAEDMPRRLWSKLAVNAGINPTTALARVPNGALVAGDAEETAREAAREVARVARGQGVDLDPATAAAAAIRVAEATARNTASMRQDVEAGQRTEIDAINGAVLDRADEPVPVNATLTRLIRAWEREQDLR